MISEYSNAFEVESSVLQYAGSQKIPLLASAIWMVLEARRMLHINYLYTGTDRAFALSSSGATVLCALAFNEICAREVYLNLPRTYQSLREQGLVNNVNEEDGSRSIVLSSHGAHAFRQLTEHYLHFVLSEYESYTGAIHV